MSASSIPPRGERATPGLSPPHGTSLGTTAGITSVISLVAAISVLGQCGNLSGLAAGLAACSLASLMLGAGALYAGRNLVGQALDLAATDGGASGFTAARGLAFFHLGVALDFAGAGLAAAVRLSLPCGGITWIAPIAALAMTAFALSRAAAWAGEARRRRANAAS
jgi:hypothetical protein